MAGKLKILMLEDNPVVVEIIRDLLIRVKPASLFSIVADKKTFVKELNTFKPDLVLFDNALQQFNALEALEIIKKRTIPIPFILVTEAVSEEFATHIIKSGADDYIIKERLGRLPSAIDAALKKRQAEKDLQDYKYALDQSSIISITDQKGIIQYANENFCRISKYKAEELIGQDHRIINSGTHPPAYIKNLWTTIGAGKIWRGQFCNKAKDGSLYWVDATVVPFLNEKNKPYQYLAIRVDITERKKAEAALQQTEKQLADQKMQAQKRITRAIIRAEEKQRNHIGQELHDNINQILAGTKLYLSIAGNKEPRLKKLVKFPMELIENAISEIRRLTHKHVTPLKNIELKQMLVELLKMHEESSGTKTTFRYDMDNEIEDDDLKLNIYRIIQEQLNNIRKHAEATAVELIILGKGNSINLEVTDNGKGFHAGKKRNGIGISNIEQRVESFNGRVQIKTAKGKGCSIEITIPY